MSVGGITSMVSQESGMLDMRRALRESGQAESGTAPEQAATQPVAVSPAVRDNGNLMAQNFASADRQESKYIAAQKAAARSDSDMANRQSAILGAAMTQMAEVGESDNYAQRALAGRKLARRVEQEQQQAVIEETRRNLKEIQQSVEDRAREATGVTDDPAAIPSTETGSGQSVSATDPAVPTATTPDAPGGESLLMEAAASAYATVAAPKPGATVPAVDLAV